MNNVNGTGDSQFLVTLNISFPTNRIYKDYIY